MDAQYEPVMGDVPAQPVIAQVERGDAIADQLRSTVTDLISRLEHVTTPPAPEPAMTPGENLVKIEGPPLSPTANRIRDTNDVVDLQITRLHKLMRDLQL